MNLVRIKCIVKVIVENSSRGSEVKPDSEKVERFETPRKKIVKVKRRRLSLGEGKDADGRSNKTSAFYSCLPPSSSLPPVSAPPQYSDALNGVGFIYPGVTVPAFIPEMSRIEECYLHSDLHVPLLRQSGVIREELGDRSGYSPVVKQPGYARDEPGEGCDMKAGSIKAGELKNSTIVSSEVKRSGFVKGSDTGNVTSPRKTETVVSVSAETGDGVESEGFGEDIRGGDPSMMLRQDYTQASTLTPAVQVVEKKYFEKRRLR